MSQNRYVEYSTPWTSADMRAILGALHPEGPYYGMDLTVIDTTHIGIWSGFLMLPIEDGTLIQLSSEDPNEPALELTFETPIGTPVGEYFVYTIVCMHNLIEVPGGEPAVFSLEVNPLDPELPLTSIPGGTILGWIFHPGGGIPIEDRMILQAPRMRSNDLLPMVRDTRIVTMHNTELLSPAYSEIALGAPVVTPTVSPTEGFCVKYSATTAVITRYNTSFQIPARGYTPQDIEVRYNLGLGSSIKEIRFEMFDNDGTAVLLEDGGIITWISPGDWQTVTKRVLFAHTDGVIMDPAYNFTKGGFYTLIISHAIPILGSLTDMWTELNYVKIRHWPYPLEDIY